MIGTPYDSRHSSPPTVGASPRACPTEADSLESWHCRGRGVAAARRHRRLVTRSARDTDSRECVLPQSLVVHAGCAIQEGVFISEAFRDLLTQWNIEHRFGAVGKHGSIAVTERVILMLTQEWLRRVPVIRGMDHLSHLCDDFTEYCDAWRGHSTLVGAVPSAIHRGELWQRPDRSAKTLPGAIQQRFFPDTRATAFRLAA